MAQSRVDAEEVLNPQYTRDQLEPEAREPVDSGEGEGFGSYYPGPLVEREEKPLLDTERIERAPERANGIEVTHAGFPDETDPWGSQESRDFRREGAPDRPENDADDQPPGPR